MKSIKKTVLFLGLLLVANNSNANFKNWLFKNGSENAKNICSLGSIVGVAGCLHYLGFLQPDGATKFLSSQTKDTLLPIALTAGACYGLKYLLGNMCDGIYYKSKIRPHVKRAREIFASPVAASADELAKIFWDLVKYEPKIVDFIKANHSALVVSSCCSHDQMVRDFCNKNEFSCLRGKKIKTILKTAADIYGTLTKLGSQPRFGIGIGIGIVRS